MKYMNQSNVDTAVFDLRAETRTAAGVDRLYAVVSDLPGSSRWSPECVGGRWLTGRPGVVGSVFEGHNLREPDVVAWAPVVRGTWHTQAEVVAAEPGRTFQWAMRDSAGNRQDSVWGFDIEPAGDATRLVHHFRMGALTEGMRGIVADMSDQEMERFFAEWGAKVEGDLAVTLERIRALVETA
ncbi:MAG TPA: SRPBCC family protein [Pseudonocardia sp.]|jgi:hypothetical protein|uniref:SRPBCC family protein n=1 Tax=Pseudonocardia sp. TaxID=60912 RepID=UPI002F3F2942